MGELNRRSVSASDAPSFQPSSRERDSAIRGQCSGNAEDPAAWPFPHGFRHGAGGSVESLLPQVGLSVARCGAVSAVRLGTSDEAGRRGMRSVLRAPMNEASAVVSVRRPSTRICRRTPAHGHFQILRFTTCRKSGMCNTDIHMKTTLNFDDRILRAAKVRAAQTGKRSRG